MDSLAFAWAIFASVLVLAAVGLPLTWALGVRGYWRVGLAPAFALTIISGSAVVAPWLGLRWSPVPVVLTMLIVGGGIMVVRRAVGPRGSVPRPPRVRVDPWVVASIVAAAVLIGVRVVQIIGSPEHISQTFDNIFHLNGVRYALDEGTASSLQLGQMTSPGGSLLFYPAAWHALTSLVVQISGVSIPIAVNAVVFTTSAVIWPISALLLTRTLFGRSPAIAVSTALIAAALPGFPMLLMDYGVLYPYQLGLALLPAALAVTAVLLNIVDRPAAPALGWWILALVGVLPGVALAHPGAFVAWLALTVPMVIVFTWVRLRSADRLVVRLAIIAGFALYLVAGVLLLRVLRPPLEARLWPVQLSITEAVGQVLSVSMWYLVPAVAAAVSIAAGVVWCLIDRRRPAVIALGMYVVAAALFVVVAALPFPTLRDALTGSWYNNLPRLVAVLAVAMVPIGAYGAARTWQAITGLAVVRRAVAGWRPAAVVAVAVGCAVVWGALLQVGAMPRAVDWASPLYRLDDASPLLSADELALLERVDEHVPEDVAIAGSPWTGTSLAYAIADRPVLMPHTLMEDSELLTRVNNGLDEAERGDAVCAALDRLEVGFVLDFGPQEVHPGEHRFAGLDELATSDSVRLVDSEGDARLYEVVACQG